MSAAHIWQPIPSPFPGFITVPTRNPCRSPYMLYYCNTDPVHSQGGIGQGPDYSAQLSTANNHSIPTGGNHGRHDSKASRLVSLAGSSSGQRARSIPLMAPAVSPRGSARNARTLDCEPGTP
ncbi:hypothetical protein EVAR_87194_1 [Eumeta japonica]|uniref:Uncharacterized protein n=1 Tax=Eumeta variegata TaxID=151549 RepID=A0A4C1VV61_EUMVA|nr:hypothetical protein EVAR_87194_1 [Eumeta japonica]